MTDTPARPTRKTTLSRPAPSWEASTWAPYFDALFPPQEGQNAAAATDFPIRRRVDMATDDIELIRSADTFFLGTTHLERGNDASHGGGPADFVYADHKTVEWPDYPGNNMFNSFGNLAVDPTAAVSLGRRTRRDGHQLHPARPHGASAGQRHRVVGDRGPPRPGFLTASGAQPERSSSRRRRSRLVGRPVPGSRRNTGIHSCFGGGGGLWSTRHSAANGADTRLLMRAMTSKIRSRWWARAVTRSPTWTLAAGLTGAPLTRTWPARHASVDSDRVLNSRTAQVGVPHPLVPVASDLGVGLDPRHHVAECIHGGGHPDGHAPGQPHPGSHHQTGGDGTQARAIGTVEVVGSRGGESTPAVRAVHVTRGLVCG